MVDLALVIMSILLSLMLRVMLVSENRCDSRFVSSDHVSIRGGVGLAEVGDLGLVGQLELSEDLMGDLLGGGVFGLFGLEGVVEGGVFGGGSLHLVLQNHTGLLLQLRDLILIHLLVLRQLQLRNSFQILLP